jgi:hypothetical protein
MIMQVSPRIFNHNLKRTKENKKGKREKGESKKMATKDVKTKRNNRKKGERNKESKSDKTRRCIEFARNVKYQQLFCDAMRSNYYKAFGT